MAKIEYSTGNHTYISAGRVRGGLVLEAEAPKYRTKAPLTNGHSNSKTAMCDKDRIQ